MKNYILVVDQGTTSTKTSIYSTSGDLIADTNVPIKQIYPEIGWVEHDPYNILKSVTEGIERVLTISGINPKSIAAVGIDNQGETVIPFDRISSEPLYNAIVWQDSRTSDFCNTLKERYGEEELNKKTGLFFDPYFSNTKLQWLKENVDEVKRASESGRAVLATSDVWLLHMLTGRSSLKTDTTTASRTGIFNINTLEWDEDLLEIFNLSLDEMPEVVQTVFNFGECDPDICSGVMAPIYASCVDQQASMFGHLCLERGEAKITYGTGGFLLLNIGGERIPLKDKIITTVGAQYRNDVDYLLDGGVYCVGSCINWLKDKIGLLDDVRDCDRYAMSVDDNGGVFFIPALAGLSVPYWSADVRGAFMGLSLMARREHFVRALLEGIAYRFYEIIDIIRENGFSEISFISADGGVSNSDFLMKFQASITGITIKRKKVKEITSLGMFYLAALGIKMFHDVDEIKNHRSEEEIFYPDKGFRSSYDEWKRLTQMLVNHYHQ